MAGGKETPRQKMIGMMYLVLTALLALNVSKEILDAFVEIEKNIQHSSITQLEKGNEDRSLIEAKIAEAKNEMIQGKEGAKEKYERLLQLRTVMDKIDANASRLIKKIDDAKLLILEKTGEDVSKVSPENPDVIVWKKYDLKNPLMITELNLSAVQSKDNFDVPFMELIGSEISAIDQNKPGMSIWKDILQFRRMLVMSVGTYYGKEGQYVVNNVTDINQFAKVKDLKTKVSKMITGGGNKPNVSDITKLTEIYELLTKLEFAQHGESKNIHWVGRTFDHAPLVGALASLTSLQMDVLAARARAFALLKTRITGGAYTFNEVRGFAYASSAVVDPNQDFTVDVFVGAFDSEKVPNVQSISGGGTLVDKKNGKATYKFNAGGTGSKIISGKVGVPDTYGNVTDWLDFETEVAVNSSGGEGSIGLPDVAVLYAGWPNKITAAVSGASITTVTVTIGGKNCPKQGNFYIANVIASKQTQNQTLVVSGRDKSGKEVARKELKVRVKPFPEPSLKEGSQMSKTGGRLYLTLGGCVLEGVQYEITSMRIFGKTYQGNQVPAEALRSVTKGSDVPVLIFWKRVGSNASGSMKRTFLVN